MPPKRRATQNPDERDFFMFEGEKVYLTKAGQPDMRYNSSKRYKRSLQANNAGEGAVGPVLRTREGRLVQEHHVVQSVLLPIPRARGPPQPTREQIITRSRAPLVNKLAVTGNEGSVRMQAPVAIDQEAATVIYERAVEQPSSAPEKKLFAIPSTIPTTIGGWPDLRHKRAVEWVRHEAVKALESGNNVPPDWLPRRKDGTLDCAKKIVELYMQAQKATGRGRQIIPTANTNARTRYYMQKMRSNRDFCKMILLVRQMKVPPVTFVTLNNEDIMRAAETAQGISDLFREDRAGTTTLDTSEEVFDMPNYIPEIDGNSLEQTKSSKLGQGTFGIVYKGTYDGELVAIKQLHLGNIRPDELQSFRKEARILATFGSHPNLIKLVAITTEPHYSLVMEFAELGSLQHLLYHNKNDMLEAKITDGRYKKRIVDGICNGIRQLHSVNIIHNDIKPANILITTDFTAKVSDFGLSALRGKAQTLLGTQRVDDQDNFIAGTAAYMAPELLDGCEDSNFQTDAYSFGITLNEILHEDEPYSQNFAKFAARGPFGAAFFAKKGERPYLNSSKIPRNLVALIQRCWAPLRIDRPNFYEIAEILSSPDMKFPNFVDVPLAWRTD